MTNKLVLRRVQPDDLDHFFQHQQDPDAVHMAAFTAKDPSDQEAFLAHWTRIQADDNVIVRTILFGNRVAGHVLSYLDKEDRPEVSYWIDRRLWNRGIATRALKIFLAEVNTTRPIYARVASDNLASRRVLEKCGFEILDQMSGFANARDREIDELLFVLTETRAVG
jgi:RimJ/RimL family protein N-acetyltransferase